MVIRPGFSFFTAAMLAIIFTISCNTNSSDPQLDGLGIIEITKWKDDFQAVYSPTFDTGYPPQYEEENNWLLENGLFLDYEIVSATYAESQERVDFILEIIEHGFGYFGHGHTHINHDVLNYQEAYDSFKLNYDFIEEIGLRPISYAYPGGSGLKSHTQNALYDSGFLSGRLFQPLYEGYGPYILPGNESEPPNWFALPSLRMEDYDFNQCGECVNNPQEFFEILDENIERGSWLISTYHAIGYDGDTRPVAWGFYRRDNFFEEMTYVKEQWENGILWLATMNDVTLYIRQRNAAVYEIERIDERAFSLYFDNDLDNDFYDLALTVRFEVEQEFLGNIIVIMSDDGEIIFEELINSPEFLVNLRPSDKNYEIVIK